MRSVSWLSLVVGLLLIPAAIAIGVGEHNNLRSAEQSHLDQEATSHAAAIEAYFDRARSITLLTANVAAFREAASEPGSRAALVAHQSPALRRATQQLAYLERLYPSSIGEACFIVSSGGELARVTRGLTAPAADLSADESPAVFYRPTFALPPDQAYQASPYRSPDMEEWVISNSAPVFGANGGQPIAIVHFEVTMESFRRTLAATSDGDEQLLIVDADSGAVIADAAKRLAPQAALGDPGDHRFARVTGAHTEARIDDHLAAARSGDERAGNANHWVIVAMSKERFPTLLGSLGPAPISLLIVGMILIGFAVLNLRTARRELEHAAHTDNLTGLPNRRSLMADLERAASRASLNDPTAVLLFDLDGFKGYNDAFGHVAGDALLARLGVRLEAAVAPMGQAYRLGGDEFCVIGDGRRQAQLEAAACAALSEAGEGFAVSSSYGSVALPAETADPVEALRLADQRMYQRKGTGRAGADAQSKAVLLRMLVERDPDLGNHVGGVARLADVVAIELGVEPDARADLVHAAELHDIGKMAVPDAILNKPGPLDDAEWTFMKTHTLIGERILCAAPALTQAARLVRSSHERWDGSGYPDAIAGEDIPLGARIIFACDALDAIIAERPYARGRTEEEALAELGRCAGTQFDPTVVEALAAVLAREGAERAISAVPA
jgi:diguanylate cyclase (GGDEF)-like protein